MRQALTEGRTTIGSRASYYPARSWITPSRADVVPHVKFDLHNSPCTTNPLGVKGAGEEGAIGASPAVVKAIVDAIHAHTGIKPVDMPVTVASL